MAQVLPTYCPFVRGKAQLGDLAGETLSLPRTSAGDDLRRSLAARTGCRGKSSSFDDQRTENGRRCGGQEGSSGSLSPCSALSPSYYPAGKGASCAPARTAGSGKGQAASSASTSSSQGHSSLGRKSRAAASSAPKGSESQSELTQGSPSTSLPGPPEGQLAPSSDLVVGESEQEPRQQRRARRGLKGERTSSGAEAVSAASSSYAAPALDADIPEAAVSTAVNRGQHDATAPGSRIDLSSQPTKKASRGRRAKLPPVEDGNASTSTDEDEGKPGKTRLPKLLTGRRKGALPCPSWDDLMSTIHAKPLTSLLGQQGPDEPQEGSADEVLRALTLLGLPHERAEKLMNPKTGLLRHLKVEGLIDILELYQEYGLSTGQVFSLLKDVPKSFGRDIATLRQILDFLLDEGVTRSKLGTVVVGSRAVKLSLEDNLKPKATFLSSLGAGNVGQLVDKAPALLKLQISRLQDCALVLRAAFGEEEWVRVLEANPKVLTYSAGDMDVLIRVIQGRYQLEPGVLATMLSRVTRFLKTTEVRMEATLDLLESVLGLDSVVNVLTRQPQVLFGDTTTIRNLLRLMTPETVRDILLTNPQILRSNWSQQIEPALCYVVERCGMSYEEAVRAGVFGKSLEGRVKPRVEFLLSQGMVFGPAEQGHMKKGHLPRNATWSLSTVLTCSLEEFHRRFPEFKGR